VQQGFQTAGRRDRPARTIAGISLATLALTIVAIPGEVQARKYNSGASFGFFGYEYGDEPRYYKPKPRTVKRKAPKPKDDAADVPVVAPYKADGSPLFLMVSLKKQRVTVYDSNNERVAEAPISSGRIGFATPTGVFTVLEKNRVHFSNLYDSAPMPNMQRITWSGVALHAGDLPGYPASHGCIRLPRNFSQQLFGMTKLGTRVVISREPVEPASFNHAKMFAAYPPESIETAAIDRPEPGAAVQTVSVESTNPGAMTQTLDIAAADGAEAPPAISPLHAKRKAEKLAAEVAFEAAKAGKTALEDAAKVAVADADAAKLGIRAANVEVAKLEKALRSAQADRDKGDRQLADYTRKYSGAGALPADEQAAAAEEERLLETNALALSDAVDAAQRAVEAAKQSVREAEAQAAAIDQKRRDAIAALSDANVKVRTTGVAVANLKATEALRKYPVSVYISRKAGRLYVRQNQKPVFEAPVTFDNPDQPLGTHVYSAVEYGNAAKTEMRWNVVSIPATVANAKPDTRSRLEKLKAKVQERDQQVPAPVAAIRQTPQAALERVTVDEASREQIVDAMKPGSSVIITDHGISNETGKFTDFIVLTNQ
jgi:lipoprotein-anchoring transpeptidase ErfK/SrfK